MTTPSGQRNRRITFERPVAERSGMGREPAQGFVAIGKAWAKVTFGSGAERREAGVEGADQAATFRVLSTPRTREVTERDRIKCDDRAWDITSIAPIGVNDEIEFTGITKKG